MVAVALISSLLRPKQFRITAIHRPFNQMKTKRLSIDSVMASRDILKYLVSDISAVFHTVSVIEIRVCYRRIRVCSSLESVTVIR